MKAYVAYVTYYGMLNDMNDIYLSSTNENIEDFINATTGSGIYAIVNKGYLEISDIDLPHEFMIFVEPK